MTALASIFCAETNQVQNMVLIDEVDFEIDGEDNFDDQVRSVYCERELICLTRPANHVRMRNIVPLQSFYLIG